MNRVDDHYNPNISSITSAFLPDTQALEAFYRARNEEFGVAPLATVNAVVSASTAANASNSPPAASAAAAGGSKRINLGQRMCH